MNKENLLRMADHIETVPEQMFHMGSYRFGSLSAPVCNSIGCVIGHCTVLTLPSELPTFGNGEIDFGQWSDDFTEVTDDEWSWCFSNFWSSVDNTPIGAAKRIRYLVEHGLPDNWEDQMNGDEPLCY